MRIINCKENILTKTENSIERPEFRLDMLLFLFYFNFLIRKRIFEISFFLIVNIEQMSSQSHLGCVCVFIIKLFSFNFLERLLKHIKNKLPLLLLFLTSSYVIIQWSPCGLFIFIKSIFSLLSVLILQDDFGIFIYFLLQLN